MGRVWGGAWRTAFQSCRAAFMIPAITGNWDMPGGCVMGGGQPCDVFAKRKELRRRAGGLFGADGRSGMKSSGENPDVRAVIAEMGAEKERRLLHRNL